MLLLPFLFLACGCNRVDSWARYMSGGNYPSNNFGVDGAGATLVLSSPVSGHGDIYQFDLATGTRKQLTTDEQFESDPVISRDGTKIVFAREASGSRSLWLHDTARGTQQRLTSGSFYDMPWDFSADGRYIMVFRTPASSKTGSCVIISSNPADQTETKVPGFAGFAPDSSRYCYSNYDSGVQRSTLRVGNLTDRTEHELGFGSIPEWSPSGDGVAAGHGVGDAQFFQSTGRAPQPRTDLFHCFDHSVEREFTPFDICHAMIVPDGQRLNENGCQCGRVAGAGPKTERATDASVCNCRA